MRLPAVNLYNKKCVQCGSVYISKKAFGKFCSILCKSKNYKERDHNKVLIKKQIKERYLSKEAKISLEQWVNNADQKLVFILKNANYDVVNQVLKDLGYNVPPPQKEWSVSLDGNLLIVKNLVGKYNVMKKVPAV